MAASHADDGMTDRELLIEIRTDQRWMKDKLSAICSSIKDHNGRIHDLEIANAEEKGGDNAKEKGGAFVIAVIALLVSIVSCITAIITVL